MIMTSIFQKIFTVDLGSVFSRNAHVFCRSFLVRLFTTRPCVFPQFLDASFKIHACVLPHFFGASFHHTRTCFTVVFGRVLSRNMHVFSPRFWEYHFKKRWRILRSFGARILKKRGRLLPQLLGAFFFKKRGRVLPQLLGTYFQETRPSFATVFGRFFFSRNVDVFCGSFWALCFFQETWTSFAAVFVRVFSRNVDVFCRSFWERISRNMHVFSLRFWAGLFKKSTVFFRSFWAHPFNKRAYSTASHFPIRYVVVVAIFSMRLLKTRA